MNRPVGKRFVFLAVLILSLALGATGLAYAARQSQGTTIQPAETLDREQGVLIASVLPESPAAEAGVVRGDILLALGGEAVNSLPELYQVIDQAEAGSEVSLELIHGDEVRHLTVTVDERGLWGMLPCDSMMERLTSSVAPLPWFELSPQVREVVAGSPAEAAGLQVGDIIVGVDNEELKPWDDLASIVGEHRPGEEVALELHREGEILTLTASLGEHPDEANRAFLGIRVAPAMPAGITEFSIERGFEGEIEAPGIIDAEILVQEVIAGSAAEEAGLQAGDLIVAVEGERLEGWTDPAALISAYRPGDSITLTVERDGEELEIVATLGEAPDDLGRAPDDPGRAYLGIVIAVEIEEFGGRFEGSSAPFTEEWFPHIDGSALVIEVTPGSPAEEAGLQEGDLITSLNGEALPAGGALAEAIEELSPGDAIKLTVERAGEEIEITAVLAEQAETAGEAWLGVRYQPLGGMGLIREHEMLDMPGAFDYGGEILRWEGLMPKEGEHELGGLVVAEVEPNSATAEAGLEAGDLITALNGEPVMEVEALESGSWQAGESLTLTVRRPGLDDALELSLTVGEDGELGIAIGASIHLHRSGDGDASLMTEAELSILKVESDPLELWADGWAPDSRLFDEWGPEWEHLEIWGEELWDPADHWSDVF